MGNSDFTTNNMEWKIWDIDNQNLYLISSKATLQGLKLKGELGYNNGVTLLDEICSKCYSANYTGIKVTNLKIEHLERVMTLKTKDKFGIQMAEITDTRFYAPYIWRQHEVSLSDGMGNRSIAYDLTTQTGSTGVATPYYTDEGGYMLPDCIYSDIIGNNTTYSSFLSTRYCSQGPSGGWGNIFWGLYVQNGSALAGYGTNGSFAFKGLVRATGPSDLQISSKLRPFVTIPLSSLNCEWNSDRTIISISPAE